MAPPLSLALLFDTLPVASVRWDIQRNDELDGNGDGDVWTAELAEPLWTGDITLDKGFHDELKQVAARIRALDGTKQAFMCCDPLSQFPQGDPDGSLLGASLVQIRAVAADRRVLQIKGLPAGYQLTVGDKVQITQDSLIRFVEIGANATATGAGNLDASVFPRLPLNLAINALVTLIRPACPVIIAPGSHNPGTARGSMTEGATFKVLQKKRTS